MGTTSTFTTFGEDRDLANCVSRVEKVTRHVSNVEFGEDRGLEVESYRLESRVVVRFWGDERSADTFRFQKRTLDLHPDEVPALIAALEQAHTYLEG